MDPAGVQHHFEFHVFVCCNSRPDGHARGSCAAKGSEGLRNYMKARTRELGIPYARVNSAGCLDRCELGPCAVIYPRGDWVRLGSQDDVNRVLEAARRHLAMPPDLALPLPIRDAAAS